MNMMEINEIIKGNKVEKIYVDMDGVLTDFWGGLKEMCGDIDDSDMDNVWNAMRSIEHFYLKLKPIKGSIEMINSLVNKYKDKVEILSSIPTEKKGIKYAEEDKRNWVKEHIGDIKVNICYRKEKASFAKNKGCILIDDYIRNVDEWNANGGTGILFNQ